MDDVTHAEHGTQIDIAGYCSCRNEWCGELFLAEIARHTQDLCPDCFRGHLGAQIAAVEVVSKGQRLSVTHRRTVESRSGRSKGNRGRAKAVEKARHKAMKRLRSVFPDLYDVFYAEERARLGLDPWTADAMLSEATDPGCQQTMEFARVYHHLTEHGVDVNGLEE